MSRTPRLVLCAALALGALAGCAPKAGTDGRGTTPVWEDPDADPYNFYRAVSYTLLRTRQYMKATQSIKRMVKLHPERPEPHYLMARAFVGMEQLEAARKLLQRAIGRDESYAPAHAQLGVLLNMLGRHKEADVEHRRAIALAPGNAAYRNNLGFSLYMQSRLREAVKSYLAALERDAAQKRTHNNLGFAYAKLGDMDQALAHFKLAGPPAQAINNLGFVAEERGQLERAYALYAEAVEQDGELIQARRNLERVSLKLGRPLPDPGVQSTPADSASPSGPATPPVEGGSPPVAPPQSPPASSQSPTEPVAR